MTSDETQIESFFAKYDAPTAKLGKQLRANLRDRLPGMHELVYVYENQGSLVFSYSTNDTGAAGVAGIAVYPGQVKLFLAGGPQLSKSDPMKLLEGKAKTVRYVALGSLADFDRPEIEVLIAAALKIANVRLDASTKGSVVIKAEEQKKRAIRAKEAAGPTSARRSTKARR